jgi:TonB family protein
VAHLAVAALLVLASQPNTAAPQSTEQSLCATVVNAPGDVALTQLCAGEQAMQLGVAAAKRSRERTREFRTAVDDFRRAVTLSTNVTTTAAALDRLAIVYDADHLDEPADEERVLRERIGVTPEDLKPMYRLAKLQEDRELIDAAEMTLLDARHRQPDNEEPNRMLAQFYARRVSALHKRNLQSPPEAVSNPGEPDANGVYRIGDALPAPKRSDQPVYPPEAMAAGIQGIVKAEIVIDPFGNVEDARVIDSIPLLDEAALKAVREWHFTPTVVNGQPVPVRMNVTVNFTARR